MRLVALGLSVFALCATPAAVAKQTGIKWVPLDQVQRGPTKRAPATPKAQPVVAQTLQPSIAEVPAVPAQSPVPATIAAVGGRLDLTCFGGGTANKPTTTTAFSNGQVSGTGFNLGTGNMTSWSGSGSGTTTVYGTRQQGFGDQVDIRLFGGDDRIRMPRTMLPPIHGGNGGWFKLKDIVADARSIHASAAVNFMNNPKVFIDRVTGTISISGRAGDYAGQCQAVTADAPAKF
jgi:hypothetical protein